MLMGPSSAAAKLHPPTHRSLVGHTIPVHVCKGVNRGKMRYTFVENMENRGEMRERREKKKRTAGETERIVRENSFGCSVVVLHSAQVVSEKVHEVGCKNDSMITKGK